MGFVQPLDAWNWLKACWRRAVAKHRTLGRGTSTLHWSLKMTRSCAPFLLVVALVAGCTQPKPRVLCTLENPATGERVEMYEEIWFKVPRDYDEAAHIAHWKKQAGERGYTREIP